MFARGDMAKIALQTIQRMPEFKTHPIQLHRITVPGFKDLPAAVCQLFDERGCDLVLAFGYAGHEAIDQVCSHEASLGLMECRVKYGKHVIEVFVHATEGLQYARGDGRKSDAYLAKVMRERARKHSINAVRLMTNTAWLTQRAGTGERQGWKNAKKIKL